MSTSDVPPGGSGSGAGNVGGLPPGVPPQAAMHPSQTPREARGVSFFVAIFLGMLLVVSAGLNVLLFLLSLGSFAGSGLGGSGYFDEVHVAGERGARTRVLQISIHGAIAESVNPMLGSRGGVVSTTAQMLRLAAEDEDIKGVVLDIDSPGGGVTDSDEIYSEIRRFRRDHPDKKVVALFGDMAASGGYYVAAAAERIVARPTTITGSIGVIMSGYNFAKAANDFGVESVTIKSDRTPFKDILSPMRPMRADERALLTTIVDELYDRFVTVVDDGRAMLDRDDVLEVANGAIYSASQALANGLIDEIGDRESVLRWFEQEIDGEIAIVEFRRQVGLADLLFGARTETPGIEQTAGQLLTGLSGPRFLYFWEGGR